MNLQTATQDLVTPSVVDGDPVPGLRVRMVDEAYADGDVHHALYLPGDWQAGKQYPVILEYAGNQWQTSPGTVEGSNLGYGLSGGADVIWVCLPFVDIRNRQNALSWWGDVDATVDYCKKAVAVVCDEFGGDLSNLILAGFSRGAIACSYIGLHDDEIASLWRGFFCHSHYDGARDWPYAGSDRQSAGRRLSRLGKRPQFVSHENDVSATETYLREVLPDGDSTFLSLPFADHTDTWVLRDIPERAIARGWLNSVLGSGCDQGA